MGILLIDGEGIALSPLGSLTSPRDWIIPSPTGCAEHWAIDGNNQFTSVNVTVALRKGGNANGDDLSTPVLVPAVIQSDKEKNRAFLSMHLEASIGFECF